uniref:Photosystem II protein N n=1 Tax=Aphyllon fasciculatum TaxID=48537 RepID=A0A385Y439_APHFC|nr:photosystem II protein N [Aphyllon fasciculatum]
METVILITIFIFLYGLLTGYALIYRFYATFSIINKSTQKLGN